MLLLLKSETRVAGHARGDAWVHDYIRRSAKFSAAKHKGQMRKDGKTPYINHPVTVANILAREGGSGDHQEIAAAILHDTMEDTDTSHEELAREFGQPVADLVRELTNDPKAPDKHASQLDKAALLSESAARVKMADKIANLRDIISRPPTKWSTERKLRYFAEAREVVGRLAWASPTLAAVFARVYDDGVASLSHKTN